MQNLPAVERANAAKATWRRACPLVLQRRIHRPASRFRQPRAHSPSPFPLPAVHRPIALLARRGVAFAGKTDMANDLISPPPANDAAWMAMVGQSCVVDLMSYLSVSPQLNHQSPT